MNHAEYLEWTKHTLAAFPAVHRVLDHSAESRERSKQWLAALASVKLVHAKAAIDAMLRGDFEPPKYDWGQLPAFVRRYCTDQCNAELRQTTDAYYSGPTVRCLHCQDSRSGFVAIWNPEFLGDCDEDLAECESLEGVTKVHRAWRRQAQREPKYMTMAVPCCCESPAAVAKRTRPGIRYKPKRHCSVGPLRHLQEFLADNSRHEWDPEEF